MPSITVRWATLLLWSEAGAHGTGQQSAAKERENRTGTGAKVQWKEDCSISHVIVGTLAAPLCFLLPTFCPQSSPRSVISLFFLSDTCCSFQYQPYAVSLPRGSCTCWQAEVLEGAAPLAYWG